MFENLTRFFKKMSKSEPKELEASTRDSKETAKERLHMVLMQDRANVSADFLELMKQEIIDVIKKYIEVYEDAIDVRLITKVNEDGSNGTPSLYANIPIMNIRNDMKVENYKFALQSDGSIIAQKIEEPKEEIENTVENNIDKIKEDKNLTENKKEEETQNIIPQTEEIKQDITQKENERIKDIIPAITNIEKIEELKDAGVNLEINSNQDNISLENEHKEKIESKIDIMQLKKSAKRGRPKKKDKKKEEKRLQQELKEQEINNFQDEDDDDVTFDDLLKAAEEEDRKKAEQEKKEG